MAETPKEQTDFEYWTELLKKLGVHPLSLLGYDTSYLRDETKQQLLMDMDPPSKEVH